MEFPTFNLYKEVQLKDCCLGLYVTFHWEPEDNFISNSLSVNGTLVSLD